ncbi:unnamed protein product [Moneuplotes crassus]|uniref:Uncharacterized protein n=1 Tax=Euplotes crassus TaxID=5936 RepID=A0AAD1XYC7_EUPCR|nr:unnamed protein product [Moneuplotes crassus]
MLAGRGGVLASIGHRRRNKYKKPEAEDVLEYPELISVQEDDKMVFKKRPILIWCFSLFCFIVGFFMLYHFTFGSFVMHFDVVEQDGYRIGYWWEYLAASIIIGLGILFLSVAVIEKVEFNNRLGYLKIEKRVLFFAMSKRTYFLSEIKSIKVVKRGMKSKNNNTIHYNVYIEFTERNPVRILEDYSIRKSKVLVLALRKFLRMQNADYDKIEVVDKSEWM